MTGDATISATFDVIPAYALTVHWVGDGSGRVASDPAGIDCPSGVACNAEFLRGTAVTLTATPDDPSTFVGWSGHCSGSATTCTVTMENHRPVSAEFNDPNVRSQVVGPGGNFVTSEDGGLTLAIPAGAVSENRTITIRRLDPDNLPEDLLDLAEDPGILAAYDLGPDGLQFDEPVTATMNTGWVPELDSSEFETRILAVQDGEGRGFAGDQESFVDPETGELIVRGTLEHFSKTYAWDDGIRFRVIVPLNAYVGEPFEVAAYVALPDRLAEHPYEGEYLDRSGPPLQANITSNSLQGEGPILFDYVCTEETSEARYAATLRVWFPGFLGPSEGAVHQTVNCAVRYQFLTVHFEGTGSGRVASDPTGIDCPSSETDCAGHFVKGTEVTLTATPDDGSTFCGWTGGSGQTESSPTVKVTMDADGSVTACFEKEQEEVVVTYGLDHRDIDAQGGRISAGQHVVDLVGPTGEEVAGDIVVEATGDDWWISANGTDDDHVGGNPGDPLSFLLGESDLPGMPTLDEIDFELLWIGNADPVPVLCRTRSQAGEILDESTLTFPDGRGTCPGGWQVEIQSLEGFATVQVTVTYSQPVP